MERRAEFPVLDRHPLCDPAISGCTTLGPRETVNSHADPLRARNLIPDLLYVREVRTFSRSKQGNQAQEMTDIIEPLSTSRQFQLTRRVALSDTDPSGRLRLDACARFLQDVAAFDAIDADISVLGNWVLRRNTIRVTSLPAYGTAVRSKTYLTGSGRAWVERTSVISDIDSGRTYLTARALWVLTHSGTGAPISVPEALYDIYGPLALQHKVTIRDAKREPLPPGASLLPWQIRYCDQDILSHLNNATYLEVLEEVLHRENISVGPDQQMTCQVIYRESTSYDDQCDAYFLISEDGGATLVSIYFANNNQVRTNIELKLPG